MPATADLAEQLGRRRPAADHDDVLPGELGGVAVVDGVQLAAAEEFLARIAGDEGAGPGAGRVDDRAGGPGAGVRLDPEAAVAGAPDGGDGRGRWTGSSNRRSYSAK